MDFFLRSSYSLRINQALNLQEIIIFSFFLVGFQAIKENKKAVKPLVPFTKNFQTIVHGSFIDYETGKEKEGSQYFKPLSRTILQYAEHMENKFDGDLGVLERKNIQAERLIYIGKEENKIEDQPLDVEKLQIFINEEEIINFILALTPKQARKIGIKSKKGPNCLKKKTKERKLNFNTPNTRKIIEYYYS